MDELGLDLESLAGIFVTVQERPYALIAVPPEKAASLAAELGTAIRRYYVADSKLEERHRVTTIARSELVRWKLPDRGSVMAGDFGEILTAVFHGAQLHPAQILDPKKWRLKQDRTKPAPHSDIVQFIVPLWPLSSAEDRVLCAEVKTKSTDGASTPVLSAIADSRKDQDGRLVKTLLWLRERASFEELGTVTIETLNRFINAIDHPEAAREYRAVAVVSADLLDKEIAGVDLPPTEDCTLVVISVPDLKTNYEATYEAAAVGADTPDSHS